MGIIWKLLCALGCYAVLGRAAPSASGPAPAAGHRTADTAEAIAALPASCSSQIYCQGELLRVIQNAHLYTDSKTFIDMKLIKSPADTLQDFDSFMKTYNDNPSKDQVLQFVNSHFEDGDELVAVDLEDWVEKPAILSRIADPELQQWAYDLNAIWKTLSRKVNESIKENSDRYSIIYTPHNFVVPGGRFRELYYWDTYWVIRGLILSDMSITIKSVIENLLYLMDNYGIIPNGARVYYLERTQPPVLSRMVLDYVETTKDEDFLRENIHILEREFDFWINNRTLKVEKNGKVYTVAQYYAPSKGPRPESYREDYTNAEAFSDDTRKEQFYIDLKSAAESGWDFSGRWFITNGTNEGNLTDIHTRDIVPVDANAFLCGFARHMSHFNKVLGNHKKAAFYARFGKHLQDAIEDLMWNEKDGSWYDYDILNKKQRSYFYPSNIAPLWTKCYDEENIEHVANKVVGYLRGLNLLKFPGGIPTSLSQTGQQWDLPNAWPPLQHIIVRGLYDSEVASARELALEFAQIWIASNHKAYVETDEMFEKYDAELPGQYGGGGEYTVQSGFGWTNGVVLDFLNMFPDKLKANISNSQ